MGSGVLSLSLAEKGEVMNRKIVAMALIVAFAVCSTVSAQDFFPKKAWKEFKTKKGLDYSIYLPKKFRPIGCSLSYAEMFKRFAGPVTVMSVGLLGNDDIMSKTDFYNLVEDIYWDTYLDYDYEYYSDYEPSPIVTVYGAHGYGFQLHEWYDLDKVYSLFQFFQDAEGNIYMILAMSALNHSPNVGQATTFCMTNGCGQGLIRPLADKAVSPAARVALIKGQKEETLRTLLESLK